MTTWPVRRGCWPRQPAEFGGADTTNRLALDLCFPRLGAVHCPWWMPGAPGDVRPVELCATSTLIN